MSGNVSLTPKQEQLIGALLEGLTIVEAAEKCKVTERTAHRWLKDATFQQFYGEARQRLLNHSITALQLNFENAVQTLHRHTNATKTIPRDQIRAAEVIVDKTLQTAKLMERIAELEAQLAEQEQNRMYKVIFDLRRLTKAERDQLEAIECSCAARETAQE